MSKRKALPDSPLAALGIGGKPKRSKATKTPKTKTAKTTATKAAAEGTKRARTIYLPPDLDRRLRVHAAIEEQAVSDVIAAALKAYLNGKG